MNILIISPFSPYPLNQGGKIRVFNIVKSLSRFHSVTLACLSDIAITESGPLREYCKDIVAVTRKQNIVKDLISFLFGREPFNYVAYSSDQFRNELQRLRDKRSFDLVQIEFSTMWQYADIFKGVPVVLDAHNIESDIIHQVREFYKDPLRKLLYSLEERKLRAREEQAWRESRICFTVSENERKIIASYLGHSETVITIPNGVDPDRFSFIPKTGRHNRILFIGGMRYQPNLDAASYLLNDIMPMIRRTEPNIKLDIVGSELWRIKNHPAYRGTEFHENVPDVLPYFRQADVLAVPLRSGAGTRVKILEAMAAGLPIVTTSKGCEGIAIRSEEHLMIADSPDEFASAIKAVIENDALGRAITRRARSLVQERYTWDGLVKEMVETYKTADLFRS